MPEQPDGVHTIPVPHGWSPEQAWEGTRRIGPRASQRLVRAVGPR
jgi:hypothetical protein